MLASSLVRDLTGLNHAATATQAGIAANVDDTNLRRAVLAAAQTGDVVVVVMHWNTERTTCADDRQRVTVKRPVADGADIVVGGHAHRPQGSGWNDDACIAYGLGNFVWYNSSGPNAETGVLTLSIDAYYSRSTTHAADPQGLTPRQRSVVTATKYVPLQIGSDGVPRAVSAQQAQAGGQAWAKSAACGGLTTNPPR
ncbi:MAG: CapA family protein [Humibacillus sp.]|nr:CapA family protein [Humibacillus sp.]MDN5778835.1 CapA family protein [Humibacillus sp.]